MKTLLFAVLEVFLAIFGDYLLSESCFAVIFGLLIRFSPVSGISVIFNTGFERFQVENQKNFQKILIFGRKSEGFERI